MLMARPVGGFALAHVGLWTFDFDMMVDFYVSLFGFVVSDRGEQNNRQYAFLTASAQAHHQLVIVSGRQPTQPAAPGGLNQISFGMPTLNDLRTFHARLADYNVSNIVTLTHGNAWSVYFLDPEGNRLEVFVDTPWHMPQPFARKIDLTQSDAELFAFTEELCRRNPGSRPINEWHRWALATLGGGGDGEQVDQ